MEERWILEICAWNSKEVRINILFMGLDLIEIAIFAWTLHCDIQTSLKAKIPNSLLEYKYTDTIGAHHSTWARFYEKGVDTVVQLAMLKYPFPVMNT